MRGFGDLFVGAVLLCVPTAVRAQTLPPDVQAVIGQYKGQLYFAAKDLQSSATIGFRPDRKVQTASVIKVPLLAALFNQAAEHRLALEDLVACTDSNRVEGSGILQSLGAGLQLTLRDAAVLMIIVSDNTATNMLIDKVGVDSVNTYLRKIGLKETTLFKKVFKPASGPLPEEQKKWGLGVTTPEEMLSLLEKLYRKQILDPASCEDILSIMKQQTDRAQIPRYLVGPGWEKVQIANKTGALDRVRNDVGIVFTPTGDYILSLFAQESEDQKWTVDNEATLALARLSLAILTYFRAGH
jgi:beta-lactamase class A